MIKWDNSFLSSQSDFVFLKSTLALITEWVFDLTLGNRQVRCRHKTFCYMWWLIRELEACGRIPLLDLRLLVGVRWVEAGRQITLIPQMAHFYGKYLKLWPQNLLNFWLWGIKMRSKNWWYKKVTHPSLQHVAMVNFQNPMQLLRGAPVEVQRAKGIRKRVNLRQGLSQISAY